MSAAREERGELGLTDETIVKDQARFDAETLGALLQHQPIGFTLPLSHVWMGGAEDDVDRLRMTGRGSRAGRR